MNDHLLSVLCALPFLGAAILLLLPQAAHTAQRATALLSTAATFGFSAWIAWTSFDPQVGAMQLAEATDWIPRFHIQWALGIDGLSLSLLLLSGLVHFLAVLGSPTKLKGSKGYYTLLLLLLGGVNGVFLATDLFLFYVFWELMLLPMYFLIGIWGGQERRKAARKFILYTLFGSVLLLVAVVAVYLRSGAGGSLPSFDILTLHAQAPTWLAETGGFAGLDFSTWIFLLFFIGFAVKIPIVPFHTWLPDAHVQAPTPISVVLAGILLKLGAYGMLRLAGPLAPDALMQFAGLLATLGVINIVYGAWVALAQTDLKRLVAYSSVSHMGFFLLGLAAAAAPVLDSGDPDGARWNALAGASAQLVTHGVSAALMFFLVGALYDRLGHRDLRRMGGLGRVMPALFVFASVGFFTSLGLPMLAGFVPEALTLVGAWPAFPTHVVFVAVGLFITAAYLLRAYRAALLGPVHPDHAAFADLNTREVASMLPLVVLSFVLGMVPSVLLDLFAVTLETLRLGLPPLVLEEAGVFGGGR